MSNLGTILIVDDTLENLKLLTDLLVSEGYTVQPADSGELALSSLAVSSPDLILLDILMPGMGGFEVFRRLKVDPKNENIPVIFISAFTDTEKRVEGLKLGAVDFISKPFQREELLARVKIHMDLNQLQKNLAQKEERLRSVFEAMSEGFSIQEVICDDQGKPCDLRFVEANRAFEHQTGLKNEETLGHTLLELFPQSETYLIERYGNVGLTGEPAQFEARLGPLNKYYHVSAFKTEHNKLGVMFTDIDERKKKELIQNALYRITQVAINCEKIELLYQSIQSILGELIPTDNFYIALFDPLDKLISFPYFMDQYDTAPTNPEKIQGLTGYVFRTGRPLLASREVYNRLVKNGELEASGTAAVAWMGAPLKVEGHMIGILAVQSYEEGIQFDQEDLNLLEFVSTQLAQTIERKRMEVEIHNLSITDELTGLYNRRGFILMAEQELKLAQRFKRSELLLFGDLDNLKMINDRWGHAQGDQALKDVGVILKETLREADIAARFGGDEFVVLAVDASLENADVLRNHIHFGIEKSNNEGNRPYQLSISLGIAHYDPENPIKLMELIAQADSQMYILKQSLKGIKRVVHTTAIAPEAS